MIHRIVFASPHSLIDPSSGAAVATLDALEFLARLGFQCQGFCAAMLDHQEEVCVEEVLARQGLPYDARRVTIAGKPAKMLFTRKGRVPITLFRNTFTQRGVLPEEIDTFAAAWEQFLHANRPDAVLTYGGGPAAQVVRGLARRRGIPIVFGLHNFAYSDPRDFLGVDYVVVPSQFAKAWYWQRLGLRCHVLPYAIDLGRVEVGKQGARSGEQGGRSGEQRGQRGEQGTSEPPSSPALLPQACGGRQKYLTFVNPQATKGLFVFARMAEQIARRRPDIPILVIDSRGRGKALEQTGVDLSWAKNLYSMANTPDPRRFYAVTKILVMPSLWNESFGLVAAEAMLNGIPVIASNRGALPETVGEGGLLLDIPARYTPSTREVPAAEEVEPWVAAILRLWDDAEYYARQSAAALAWSARWRPEVLRPLYESFFRNVHPQPGPPLALRSGGTP
ncbi:MAG: glycosyltransferase [Thermoguttaceae bacterium]|jgi:glycosyltransferase involved in cell wall biosynthesis|nr:glycosyltransferase [Thermoguttaceae bacterium]